MRRDEKEEEEEEDGSKLWKTDGNDFLRPVRLSVRPVMAGQMVLRTLGPSSHGLRHGTPYARPLRLSVRTKSIKTCEDEE